MTYARTFSTERLHRARGVHLRAHGGAHVHAHAAGAAPSTRRPRVERTAPPTPERPPRARRDDTAHNPARAVASPHRTRRRADARTPVPTPNTPPRSPNRTPSRTRAPSRPRRNTICATPIAPTRHHRRTRRTRSARRNTRRPTRCPDSQNALADRLCAAVDASNARTTRACSDSSNMVSFASFNAASMTSRGVSRRRRRMARAACGDRCGDSLNRADGESRGRLTRR